MFAYSEEQAKFKSILILQQTKHNEKILSLVYILCFSALTSSFAQNKNIKDLYEQLDQAIKQSQYYINQKESRITKIKNRAGKDIHPNNS